jgi:hypothetical protein
MSWITDDRVFTEQTIDKYHSFQIIRETDAYGISGCNVWLFKIICSFKGERISTIKHVNNSFVEIKKRAFGSDPHCSCCSVCGSKWQ